jgi:serine/threonine protein kinase
MSSTEHKLALPIGTMLQQYKVEAILGYGGFGIVYQARHQRLDLLVAIKEYLPQEMATREGNTVHPLSTLEEQDFIEGLQKFLDEAKQLVQFDNFPNVVKCRDFFEDNGTAYLVMNFEDGQELSDILRARQLQNKPLNERQIIGMITPILSGLKDIHEAGVLHRDIKPANIFIRRATEVPVLIDFGAAKQNFSTHGKSQSMPYTPGYAPMEQVEAEGNLGPWTDLYAVGAMLWRIIANQNPPRVEDRLSATHRGKPDPMTCATEMGKGQYSEAFLAAIDKSLEILEQDRFQNADEFMAAFPAPPTGVTDGRTIPAEPLTIPVPKPKQKEPRVDTVVIKQQVGQVTGSVGQGHTSSDSASGPQVSDKTNLSALISKMGFALVLVVVIGGIFVLTNERGGPATAQTARLSEDVVFSKIERMYEQSNRVQRNRDIRRGFQVDKKTLEVLAKTEMEDGEDYRDTLNDIQIYTTKIQEAELEIQHAEIDLVDTAYSLTSSYREQGAYLDGLFKQKIQFEKDGGNQNKANLISGFYLKIKKASSQTDDVAIKHYLSTNLALEG